MYTDDGGIGAGAWEWAEMPGVTLHSGAALPAVLLLGLIVAPGMHSTNLAWH